MIVENRPSGEAERCVHFVYALSDAVLCMLFTAMFSHYLMEMQLRW